MLEEIEVLSARNYVGVLELVLERVLEGAGRVKMLEIVRASEFMLEGIEVLGAGNYVGVFELVCRWWKVLDVFKCWNREGI